MTARKKTTKASTKKPAAKKAPAKKASTKKPAARKAATKKPAAKKKGADEAEKGGAGGGGVSSTAVTRMNLFSLRPRVNTSFRQEDFLEARRILKDESYGSVEEAARAVAEKALSLSNDPKGRPGQQKPRRR